MKAAKKDKNALVPAGERIDHPEDLKERKLRELGAAFNRMGSDSDAEAHNAFERALYIVREIGTSFDAVFRAFRETSSLHEINADLGRQLQGVMRENARYRAMDISFKIRGNLVLGIKALARALIICSPLVAIGTLFQLGYISAAGAALLVLPVGLYQAVRGLLRSQARRTLFGVTVFLAGLIAISVAADQDNTLLHRQEVAIVENMFRNKELGPQTVHIEYPLSRLTRIVTILGIDEGLRMALDDASPVDVKCSKYYASSITVRRSEAADAAPPEQPDIFHAAPVSTFGECELYDKLSALQRP